MVISGSRSNLHGWSLRWYAKGLAFLIPASMAGGVLLALTGLSPNNGDEDKFALLYVGGLPWLMIYTAVWPYLAARLQQVVWITPRSRRGLHENIEAMPLSRLVVRMLR